MWTTEDSDKTYHIHRWSQNYFTINSKGNLCCLPEQVSTGPMIDLMDIVEEIKSCNLTFPVILRFQDILRQQVIRLNTAFREVIQEASYNGQYMGVFPIKVNQLREIVEEINDAGAPYDFGLEAGSKPELMAVLASNDNPNSLTVLNGYKDRDYLKLALIGRKMGRKIIVVVEKFSELHDLMVLAEEMNAEPLIGIRAKLSAKAAGRWSDSGGERAKFGLSIPEIVHAVQLLKNAGKLHWLKLFHFHIGSQIPDILNFKEAMTEGAQLFVQLYHMGAELEYFDVGGGLGIDYDGSKSTKDSSVNYTWKDYAEDTVYILKQACDLAKVPHPNIVSESGRALTAHHACIITNVFGQMNCNSSPYIPEPNDKEHVLVKNMRELLPSLSKENLQQVYNDALLNKQQTLNAFKLGVITLQERASVESLFWTILSKIHDLIKDDEEIPEDLQDIATELSHQYLCNFSIFQSAPDSWAIDQLLPVVPLHRLTEEPTNNCTLADITCDSDGKLTKFISSTSEYERTIKLHDLKEKEDYFLGVFLTGAYQDIIGDMHNLFGRLTEIHIFADPQEPTNFYIDEIIPGEKSDEILRSMQYNTDAMAYKIRKELERMAREDKFSHREAVKLLDFYEDKLRDYTYLKKLSTDI